MDFGELTLSSETIQEVKEILKTSSNTSFLSLKQYWEVYEELAQLDDTYFISRLRDRDYVELLDGLIIYRNGVDGQKFSIAHASPRTHQARVG